MGYTNIFENFQALKEVKIIIEKNGLIKDEDILKRIIEDKYRNFWSFG